MIKTYTKGQVGLPLTVIVGAVIAALTLVTVISFTVGGTGTTFGKLTKPASTMGDEVNLMRDACRQSCNEARTATTRLEWQSSAYCQKSSNLDIDASGDLTSDEIGIKCWAPPLNIQCSSLPSATGPAVTFSYSQCGTL